MEDGDGGPTPNPPMDAEIKDSEDTESINESELGPRCTDSNCRKEMDKNMIECKPCGKYTHFACTRLPPSQLQRFMTKGLKRYICENCSAKNHQVHEDYFNNCFKREWITRESELLEAIKRLKLNA